MYGDIFVDHPGQGSARNESEQMEMVRRRRPVLFTVNPAKEDYTLFGGVG